MVKIPLSEFQRRQAGVQAKVNERGLDAVIVHSHEADFANVRYLSDFWPLFESAAVIVPAEGDPILIIGPESETFARGHSVIPDIRKILYYREAAEPDYPGIEIDTFETVFGSINGGKKVKKIGIAGMPAMPVSVYEALKESLPDVEIVKADSIMHEMRLIKTDIEISALQEAFKASEFAVQEVLDRIKPGMTELQVVGIAQEAFYRHGAEYEAHPTYCLSGVNSSHAIGRPGYRVLEKGDLVQLNIGARVAGYSPSIGLPVCMGKMSPEMKDLVSFGLEAHWKTIELLKGGTPAKDVVLQYEKFVKDKGYGQYMLYGPCHGLGMIEVERPWMETTSDYLLEENMCFQVDTFFYREEYGLRWETGARITADSSELFSDKFRKIYEIE